MNKTELIQQVSGNTGLTKKAATKAVNAMFRTIQQTLIEEGHVRVTGFGNFSVRERSQRRGRNPQTGEEILVPSRRIPTFRAGHSLKMAVKKAELKGQFHQLG